MKTKENNLIRFRQFYSDLGNVFKFKLGKILLATSTSTEIEKMIDQGWPYFAPYLDDIRKCLANDGCEEITKLVAELGILLGL